MNFKEGNFESPQSENPKKEEKEEWPEGYLGNQYVEFGNPEHYDESEEQDLALKPLFHNDPEITVLYEQWKEGKLDKGPEREKLFIKFKELLEKLKSRKNDLSEQGRAALQYLEEFVYDEEHPGEVHI